MLSGELNPFYWCGRHQNDAVFVPLILIALLVLAGVFYSIALLVAGSKHPWGKKFAFVPLSIAAIAWSVIAQWKVAWIAGFSSTVSLDAARIFDAGRIAEIVRRVPAESWAAAPEGVSLVSFSLNGCQPIQLRCYNGSEGWSEACFVYGGSREFRWGVWVSSRGNFAGMAVSGITRQRISPNVITYTNANL